MSEPAGHHGIDVRAVVTAIAALAATIVAVWLIVYGLAALWNTRLTGPNAAMNVKIPSPRLESAPQDQTTLYLAEKERVLQRNEWIDREKGIARISIEEAMNVLAASRRASPGLESSRRNAAPDESPSVAQAPGAMLPLDARFTDDTGRDVSLSSYFGRVPIVLVFGYYRCPNLCSTLMESTLVALSAADIAARNYRVVAVSIDPREHASDAAEKARAYRSAFANVPLHLLTSAGDATARVAAAAGVHYAFDAGVQQYSHPLAVLIAAPDGRISRYFAGAAFDRRDLKLALIEASQGRIGSISDRIFLRCAHFDPQTGRYSVAAMSFVRGGSAVCVLVFGVWVWRRRAKR